VFMVPPPPPKINNLRNWDVKIASSRRVSKTKLVNVRFGRVRVRVSVQVV